MTRTILALLLSVWALPALAQSDKNPPSGTAAAGEQAPAADAATPDAADADEAEAPSMPTVADMKARFAAAHADDCVYGIESEDPEATEPEVNTLSYRYDSDAAEDPDRTLTLYTFQCNLGAYNTTQVYYQVDEYGDVRPVTFAEPSLDIRYENDDFEGKVESLTIQGWTGTDELVNSGLDPDSKTTITAYNTWRGIGDASSTATYELVEDRWVLKKYDVDATYDGEENPETIVDFTATN